MPASISQAQERISPGQVFQCRAELIRWLLGDIRSAAMVYQRNSTEFLLADTTCLNHGTASNPTPLRLTHICGAKPPHPSDVKNNELRDPNHSF